MLLSTRQLILSLLTRTVPAGYTRPANLESLQIGLLSTLPADDGTGAVELVGNNYARVVRAATDANFSLVGDEVSNVADVSFNVLTGSTPDAIGFAVWDNGNVIRWAQPFGGAPQSFTFNGATDTLSRVAHGMANNQKARVFALDGLPLPGGLAANTTYYIVGATADTLQLAATEGGAAINITTDGACLIRRWYGKAYAVDERPLIPAGLMKLRCAV